DDTSCFGGGEDNYIPLLSSTSGAISTSRPNGIVPSAKSSTCREAEHRVHEDPSCREAEHRVHEDERFSVVRYHSLAARVADAQADRRIQVLA
ncbi:unnamed protein product, partial [Amoebophrya sp. A120]